MPECLRAQLPLLGMTRWTWLPGPRITLRRVQWPKARSDRWQPRQAREILCEPRVKCLPQQAIWAGKFH